MWNIGHLQVTSTPNRMGRAVRICGPLQKYHNRKEVCQIGSAWTERFQTNSLAFLFLTDIEQPYAEEI